MSENDQTDIVSIGEAIAELRAISEALLAGVDAVEKLSALVPVQNLTLAWMIDATVEALAKLRARIKEGIEQ